VHDVLQWDNNAAGCVPFQALTTRLRPSSFALFRASSAFFLQRVHITGASGNRQVPGWSSPFFIAPFEA
jgi:hypothetical protein